MAWMQDRYPQYCPGRLFVIWHLWKMTIIILNIPPLSQCSIQYNKVLNWKMLSCPLLKGKTVLAVQAVQSGTEVELVDPTEVVK